MATVSFTGFVNKQVGNPAFVLKVTESHRKKDESGEWVNNGRTFFDVKAGYESGIDVGQFPVDAQVKVTGRQKTVSREWEGKTYYDLEVAAESIAVVEPGGGYSAPTPQSGTPGQGSNPNAPQGDGWANPGQPFNTPPADQNLPF